MPLLLFMTSFTKAPGAHPLLLLAPTLVFYPLRGAPTKGRGVLVSSDGRSRTETAPEHFSQSFGPLPTLTTYTTILSTLAVDFSSCPSKV